MSHRVIERPMYMSELEAFRDDRGHVKVLTGVRRCGKSTLLAQFVEKLRAEGVPDREMLVMNLESSDFDGIADHSDLNAFLRGKVPKKGRFYLFLDEIQRVKDWERTVNALMVDSEADIYVTGSNAHLLSTDLTTYLTGRYVEVKMLPLSFREYMELRGNGRGPGDVFREYFECGGFPGIDPAMGERAVSAMLDDLYSSIVFRDMVSRGKVRKTEELGKMVTYLMLNIGNPIGSTTMARELHMNQRTVERYLTVAQGACMFYRADRYDLRSTALSPTPKYYVVDPGLRNNAVGMASKDRGRVLENIVYLELRRRGYETVVGKWGSKEVDFVTEKNGRRAYWQVCLGYYDDDTETRELTPLRAIKDSNPKTVILMDYSGDTVTRDGIRELGVTEFLLGRGPADGSGRAPKAFRNARVMASGSSQRSDRWSDPPPHPPPGGTRSQGPATSLFKPGAEAPSSGGMPHIRTGGVEPPLRFELRACCLQGSRTTGLCKGGLAPADCRRP